MSPAQCRPYDIFGLHLVFLARNERGLLYSDSPPSLLLLDERLRIVPDLSASSESDSVSDSATDCDIWRGMYFRLARLGWGSPSTWNDGSKPCRERCGSIPMPFHHGSWFAVLGGLNGAVSYRQPPSEA